MEKIVFILRFEDDAWIAEKEKIVVKSDSLEQLDRKLKEELRKAGYSGKIEVFMKFDYSTIPQWIRQYHPHYFNRSIVMDI